MSAEQKKQYADFYAAFYIRYHAFYKELLKAREKRTGERVRSYDMLWTVVSPKEFFLAKI